MYEAPGGDHAERVAAHRESFRYHIDAGLVDQLRCATNGNYALGNERFLLEMAAALGRRVARGKAGRPACPGGGINR